MDSEQKKPVRRLDWWITRIYAPLTVAWVTWVSQSIFDAQKSLAEIAVEIKQIRIENQKPNDKGEQNAKVIDRTLEK